MIYCSTHQLVPEHWCLSHSSYWTSRTLEFSLLDLLFFSLMDTEPPHQISWYTGGYHHNHSKLCPAVTTTPGFLPPWLSLSAMESLFHSGKRVCGTAMQRVHFLPTKHKGILDLDPATNPLSKPLSAETIGKIPFSGSAFADNHLLTSYEQVFVFLI